MRPDPRLRPTMTTTDSPYAYRPAGRRGSATARSASSVFCALCIALAAVTIVPGLLGYQRYVITSGSMTGAYDRGSIVYERAVPVEELRVGDVITYTPPPGVSDGGMLTHRISWTGRDALGRRLFETKGDANAKADPWRFVLDKPTQARVSFHVPLVGYAYAALSVPRVRQAVIGVPALLIAFAIVLGVVRDARREQAAGTPAATPKGRRA